MFENYRQNAVAKWYLFVSCLWLKVMGWFGEILGFFPDIVPRARYNSPMSRRWENLSSSVTHRLLWSAAIVIASCDSRSLMFV